MKSFLSDFFGFDKDAAQYAGNAALQYQTLLANKPNPVTEEWLRAWNLMVQTYGPPGATQEGTYNKIFERQNEVMGEALIDGASEAPGDVFSWLAKKTKAALNGLLDFLPWWVITLLLVLLGIYIINVLLTAGILKGKK